MSTTGHQYSLVLPACLTPVAPANHRAERTLFPTVTSDARSGRNLHRRILVCTQLPPAHARLPEVGASCFARAFLCLPTSQRWKNLPTGEGHGK
ncbi:hypothetical protein PoB_005716400 [Plakobranchus ocellatus]|uniref:Uncharacterized protein n=1 Tax=Plakobranchus ocellatus TaxID=259542 RepID=A0AAV4CIK9_9GAST|nr:hypothetical protein PoB_005716400 [Plakobranchus ocellatus]